MDCPSGKRWFRHQNDAVRRAQQDELEFGYRMKVYHCPDCGWWHKSKTLWNGLPILLLDFIKNEG